MYEEDGYGPTIGVFGGGVTLFEPTYNTDPTAYVEEEFVETIPMATNYVSPYVEDSGGPAIGVYGGGVETTAPYSVWDPTVVAGGTVQQVEAQSPILVSEDAPVSEPKNTGPDNIGAGPGFGGLMPLMLMVMLMGDS